jgi:hypothetical protein
MERYMRCKTTLGHRYRMRRCEDEVRERRLFHAALVILPVIAAMALLYAGGLPR